MEIGRRFLYITFFILIFVNLYYASWHAIHGEVNFHTDIARDFLLYQEVDEKKIILIGPRSSTQGIFHGPLWIYLTYPGYLLGNGDPAFMAWYWMLLIVVFLIGSFFVARKLFGTLASLIYIVLLSGNLLIYTRGLFNPHGALFLMPVFFFMIVLYQRTNKWLYLAGHLLTGAFIIQFQMAVGIPLMILSTLYILFLAIKRKTYMHLVIYLLFFAALGNYFVFEFRHDFNIFKSILNYAKPTTEAGVFDYFSQITNRVDELINLRLTLGVSALLSGALFSFFLIFIYLQLRKNRFRDVYGLFLFYYIGYILLSFVNKGVILEHQSIPLMALTNLIFSSFVTSEKKQLFWGIFVIIVIFSLGRAQLWIKNAQEEFLGKNEYSWRFLLSMGQKIVSEAGGKEFGYFVYSPDSLAYQPRYAMMYAFKNSQQKIYEYRKMPLTYIIAAPPPSDNTYMKEDWWIKKKANIDSKPVKIKSYLENGYKYMRYELSEEEIKVPFDPIINLGIHFR